MTQELTRTDLLRKGAAGTSLGVAALVFPGLARADRRESAQTGEIYELQAAFHRAKTTQDIELMMSLWAEDGTLSNQGDPNSPYVGSDRLRAFWLASGSFTHRRFSLVPFLQDPDTDPRPSGVALLRVPRRRGLRPGDAVDRLGHLPRRNAATERRRLGLLADDGREGSAAVGRPLLLPLEI